jgi:hypothetical protein
MSLQLHGWGIHAYDLVRAVQVWLKSALPPRAARWELGVRAGAEG